MTNEEYARQTAQQLGLLDPTGELSVLDSLMILDYATELESVAGVQIPTAELKEATFATLATVAAMLERLASKRAVH
jgi:acyl carrier protein